MTILYTRPVLVTILSVVLLVTALITFFGILGAVIGSSKVIFLGYINLIFGSAVVLAKIVCSIGLLRMRKWALFGITVTFIVDIILSIATAGSMTDPFLLVLKVAMLIYFWAIHKKFS